MPRQSFALFFICILFLLFVFSFVSSCCYCCCCNFVACVFAIKNSLAPRELRCCCDGVWSGRPKSDCSMRFGVIKFYIASQRSNTQSASAPASLSTSTERSTKQAARGRVHEELCRVAAAAARRRKARRASLPVPSSLTN